MTNLIINRVNYLLSNEKPNMYLSKSDETLFRMKSIHFKQRISTRFNDGHFLEWIKGLNDEDFVYYSFNSIENNNAYTLSSVNYSFNDFKAKFIREQLINFFKGKDFLIEPFPKGHDLSVYEKIGDFNNDWSTYRRYDFLVRPIRNEIAFNIGSENTLISNSNQNIISTDRIRIIEPTSGYIKPLARREDINSSRIIANKKIRTELGVSTEPRKFNYNHLYTELSAFYNKQLLNITNEYFKIEAGGLKNVEQNDLNKVNINENLMLFGKEKTDINAVTGMRDNGIYKPSPKATDVKFIFIYENSKDANQLYLYLKMV
ncbi:MAG: hypothetical protein IPJ32_10505 [Sphingobacteriaceae bacterium]|nr:hypothetical protein [Sphingobacteriaceae bacterium]